jgi:hypothetical protein
LSRIGFEKFGEPLSSAKEPSSHGAFGHPHLRSHFDDAQTDDVVKYQRGSLRLWKATKRIRHVKVAHIRRRDRLVGGF